MKKLILFYLFISAVSYSQFLLGSDTLYSNNIKSYIINSGIFNQRLNPNNTPGLEWPRGSGKYAGYTAGICVAGYVGSQLRMGVASYKGEYVPGYSANGQFFTDSRFRFYKIKRGDNYNNNQDWLNWGTMVPYGAPYIDVNNSGHYEFAIDTPGVRGASQTIFICLTDGLASEHKVGEGFGGGTLPLFAEVHLTAWCYDNSGYQDIQFFKWEIINKNTVAWTKTHFSVFSDNELGWAGDDYMGCDTLRRLAYIYNADNNDEGVIYSYGLNPPAVGIVSLGCIPKTYPVSSMVTFSPSTSTPGPPCEKAPNGEAVGAYNLMRGLKKDLTPWVVPNTNPPRTTKYCYSGDPESGTGWTEYQGRIANCGGSLTGSYTFPNTLGDRLFLISHGSDNFTFNVNDTVRVLAAQLIARGTNNLNSVTKLKQLTDVARQLCQNGFVIWINPISTEIPNKFNLYQNYPNPFNPVTKIKFELPKSENVIIKIYDALGREITTLANEKLKAGVYEVDWDASNYPSGVYFYILQTESYMETRKMVLVK